MTVCIVITSPKGVQIVTTFPPVVVLLAVTLMWWHCCCVMVPMQVHAKCWSQQLPPAVQVLSGCCYRLALPLMQMGVGH
jgi:hypothetical protein